MNNTKRQTAGVKQQASRGTGALADQADEGTADDALSRGLLRGAVLLGRHRPRSAPTAGGRWVVFLWIW
jgi:hypothetical protein